MGKYQKLSDYLVKQQIITVSLTYAEIETILGFSLPSSAYHHRAWWANTASHPQAKSWLNMGWKVTKVDFDKNIVLLTRLTILSFKKEKKCSLVVIAEDDSLKLMIFNSDVTATSESYSWRQIVQILLDTNPYMFGNDIDEPDHKVFADTLHKLGYSISKPKAGKLKKYKSQNKEIYHEIL